MKSLFVALTLFGATQAFALPEDPLAIVHLSSDHHVTWYRDAVVINTPDDQGNLSLKIITDDKTLSNDNLIEKMEDPATNGVATAYEVSLEQDPKTGSIIIENWRDWGTSMWSTKIWVAQRAGKVVISGYHIDWSYRAASPQGTDGSCDINFLTKKMVVGKKSYRTNMEPVEFEKATLSGLRAICP